MFAISIDQGAIAVCQVGTIPKRVDILVILNQEMLRVISCQTPEAQLFQWRLAIRCKQVGLILIKSGDSPV